MGGLIDPICLAFRKGCRRFMPARQSEAQAYTPAELETNKLMEPLPTEQPPSYQEVTATGKWEIFFLFGSDAELLRKERLIDKANGYQAWLSLTTNDIAGLMRHGLYLTPENVNVQESYVKQIYEKEDQRWYWQRYYTLADARWSGKLCVRSWDRNVLSKFRVDDLSADKVFQAAVGDKSMDLVYHFDLYHPEVNANYILDDVPMEGLWPYPRKPQGAEKNGNE